MVRRAVRLARVFCFIVLEFSAMLLFAWSIERRASSGSFCSCFSCFTACYLELCSVLRERRARTADLPAAAIALTGAGVSGSRQQMIL